MTDPAETVQEVREVVGSVLADHIADEMDFLDTLRRAARILILFVVVVFLVVTANAYILTRIADNQGDRSEEHQRELDVICDIASQIQVTYPAECRR